jgi:hypothetical protein
VPLGKFQESASIRPRTLPSKYFPNHHSSITPQFDNMYCSLDTESTVKQHENRSIVYSSNYNLKCETRHLHPSQPYHVLPAAVTVTVARIRTQSPLSSSTSSNDWLAGVGKGGGIGARSASCSTGAHFVVQESVPCRTGNSACPDQYKPGASLLHQLVLFMPKLCV